MIMNETEEFNIWIKKRIREYNDFMYVQEIELLSFCEYVELKLKFLEVYK